MFKFYKELKFTINNSFNLFDLVNKSKIKVLLYYFNDEKYNHIATLKNMGYSDYNLLFRLDEWELE